MTGFQPADYSILVRLLLVYVLTRFVIQQGAPNFRSLRGYLNAALAVVLLNDYSAPNTSSSVRC